MASPGTHKQRRLPVQQLSILALCRLSEPLASTSLYPYLPEMIRSFGIPDEEVGKWAGICAAAFSLFQAAFGIPWGRLSDICGRKPTILAGLVITMITSLFWGFSTTLTMAIAARAIAGAGNGNVGIIRTTVAEMVPYKELQPTAFSIMPMVWSVGSVFGPTLGGALANPLGVKPGERTSSGSILQQFPYLLPNLVSASFFFLSTIVGFLFLQETLETKRDRRDIGIALGNRLSAAVRAIFGRSKAASESEPLLKPGDEESARSSKAASKPLWKEVLTIQTLLNLAVYSGLSMHNTAFDQVVPVYMADRRPDPHAPHDNFLNFAGGFGLSNLTIGILNTAYSIYGMVLQFLLFPPVARKYGVLVCMKWCSALFPVAYFLMPFTLLLPTQKTQVAACFVLQLWKETMTLFAFPCATILLTNSTSSLRILGTVNGLATSVSAICRAVGPALTGFMYTQGAKHGYLIAPWWFLTALAILAALPIHAVVEKDGFGDNNESQDTEHEHEESLVQEGIEGEAAARGQPGPQPVTTGK